MLLAYSLIRTYNHGCLARAVSMYLLGADPDDTCGGGMGPHPCKTFFVSPNQKQTFLSFQAKEQAIFFLLYYPVYLPVLSTNF